MVQMTVEKRAEVKKQLALRGWRYSDLSREIGLSVGQISNAMRGVKREENQKKIIDFLLGNSNEK